MSADRWDVLVVGEPLVELAADEPLDRARGFRLGFSGDALNAAAAAARAGARVALLTRVGDDELGARLVGFAAALGIDTSLIAFGQEPTGVYLVGADPGGTRGYAYARRGSAASLLSVADVAPADVAAARTLVVHGTTLALSISCARAVAHAVRVAHAEGRTVVFDPNFRARLTTPADARADLSLIAPYVSVAVPSCPGDTRALLDTDDPSAAARALRGVGAHAAVVTRGADGVLVADARGELHLPAVVPPRVVDATGAGDAFTGTLAAHLAFAAELRDAARHGLAAAAQALTAPGGTDYLRTRTVAGMPGGPRD